MVDPATEKDAVSGAVLFLDRAQTVFGKKWTGAVIIQTHPGMFKVVGAAGAFQPLIHNRPQWAIRNGLVFRVCWFVDKDAPALAAGIFASRADTAKLFCIVRADCFRPYGSLTG